MTSNTSNQSLTHAEALNTLCTAVLPLWSKHLETAQQQAEVGVTHLLRHVSLLRQTLSQAAVTGPDTHPTDVTALLDEILMGFQFHDRTAQMLGLLQQDMAHLQRSLDPSTPTDELAVDTWLKRLEGSYAMDEQRQIHDAGTNATNDGSDAKCPSTPPPDITYF